MSITFVSLVSFSLPCMSLSGEWNPLFLPGRLSSLSTHQSAANDLSADVKSVIDLVTSVNPARSCDANVVLALLQARTDLPSSDRIREVATDVLVGLTSAHQSHQQTGNPINISYPTMFSQTNLHVTRDTATNLLTTDEFPSVRSAWDFVAGTIDQQPAIQFVGEDQEAVNHLVEEVDIVLNWFPDADPNEVYAMLERCRGEAGESTGKMGDEDWAVDAVLHELEARSNDNSGDIDNMQEQDLGTLSVRTYFTGNSLLNSKQPSFFIFSVIPRGESLAVKLSIPSGPRSFS